MGERLKSGMLLQSTALAPVLSQHLGARRRTTAEDIILTAYIQGLNAQVGTLLGIDGHVAFVDGAPTDGLVGPILAPNAQTTLTELAVDSNTGELYYRNPTTGVWLLIATPPGTPTLTYPLLLGSGDYVDFESKASGAAHVQVARRFRTPAETTTDLTGGYTGSALDTITAGGQRSVVYSWKPDEADLAANDAGLMGDIDDFLADFVTDLGAVTDRRFYFCVNHEPAPDIDPATFVAGWENFADRVIALGRPDIVPTAIYRGNGDWETSGLNNAARNTPPDAWAGAATARPWDWLPNASYGPNCVIGVDVYSYYPGVQYHLTVGPSPGNVPTNDRSLRHLMRLIAPLLRARGFSRLGIGENGIQKVAGASSEVVQTGPQYGGGTVMANRATTEWSDTDRLQRLVGLNYPTDQTYNFHNSSVGNHPSYLSWLLANAGPFPALGVGTITNPYDIAQTSATAFQNPGQGYDPGSNGIEYYTYFNSDVGAQGDYLISTAMAEAIQTAGL